MKNYIIILVTILIIISCTKNQLPTCEITSVVDKEEFQQGTSILLNIEAKDSDGEVKEVSLYINGTLIESFNQNPYRYEWNTSNEDTGAYVIKGIAIDNTGESSYDEITIILLGDKPVADFEASKTTSSPDSIINFKDQSSNFPQSWKWDFGDGEVSFVQNPIHSYSKLGAYKVNLQVDNGYGKASVFKYITIDNRSSETGVVTDYDKNIYKTIKIGDQWWMAENLKVSHFPDGKEIKLVNNGWANLNYEDSAMCFYDSLSANIDKYGAFYNWTSAKDACPTGWKLPSDDDWKQLELFLGISESLVDQIDYRGENEGSMIAGNNSLWEDGTLVSNSAFGLSLFDALPAGFRVFNGYYSGLGASSCFWSSTEFSDDIAWYRRLSNDQSKICLGRFIKSYGFSVRCIKSDKK